MDERACKMRKGWYDLAFIKEMVQLSSQVFVCM